jgi:hypothetical protein
MECISSLKHLKILGLHLSRYSEVKVQIRCKINSWNVNNNLRNFVTFLRLILTLCNETVSVTQVMWCLMKWRSCHKCWDKSSEVVGLTPEPLLFHSSSSSIVVYLISVSHNFPFSPFWFRSFEIKMPQGVIHSWNRCYLYCTLFSLKSIWLFTWPRMFWLCKSCRFFTMLIGYRHWTCSEPSKPSS